MPWTAFNELEGVAMNRFGLKCFLAFIITTLSSVAVAVAQDRCLPSRSIDRVDMKDKNTLLFTMRNGTQYENKLTGSLFGFSSDSLVFEQRPSTGQYCRMDRVGLLVRPLMGSPFTASLGYFVEVEGFGDMPEGIEV